MDIDRLYIYGGIMNFKSYMFLRTMSIPGDNVLMAIEMDPDVDAKVRHMTEQETHEDEEL